MSETILFAVNENGMAVCAHCEEEFDPDLAAPDANLEPICPGCWEVCKQETFAMSKEEYIEALHFDDGDLTAEELEAEWVKLQQWKASLPQEAIQ